jgi:hypothetical protein
LRLIKTAHGLERVGKRGKNADVARFQLGGCLIMFLRGIELTEAEENLSNVMSTA